MVTLSNFYFVTLKLDTGSSDRFTGHTPSFCQGPFVPSARWQFLVVGFGAALSFLGGPLGLPCKAGHYVRTLKKEELRVG